MTAAPDPGDAQRSDAPNTIVGRARELAALRACLGRLLSRDGGLVLVNGQAGIGKTTLVRELAELAADRGALVLSGGCYDLTTPSPYGPWIEIVSGYRDGDAKPQPPNILGPEVNAGELTSQFALFAT